jgi:predicted nucleic acid-binding protein
MTLVVDANVAIKWFVQQHGTDDARRVQAYRGALVGPAMLVAETCNGLWRHVVRGDIAADLAKTAVIGLSRWFDELVEDQLLAAAALDLAVDLNYSVYDCPYLALARARAAPLVTADQRLINRLATTAYKSHVIHLSDWT